jgi:hypothetical protein
MIDLSKLPRDPIEALIEILQSMISSYGAISESVETLRGVRHPLYLDLVINITIAKKCAIRLPDEALRQLTIDYLTYSDSERMVTISKRSAKILEAIIALKIDDHFLPDGDHESFESAELSIDEKSEIRELMSKARKLTLESQALADGQKRRVCFRIAQVENELYKEHSAFGVFMAAAYEVSNLVRQIGGDVQPIAEAIEKARTVTEKKVSGYQQIEAEQVPKRLPKPKPSQSSGG